MTKRQNLVQQRTKFLIAKNDKQKEYIKLIRDKSIVFAIGESGCGKTRCACSIALEDLTNGKVDKVILTRPVIEAGENLGFLPGDLSEKINPYMLPIFNEFLESIDEKELKSLIAEKRVEIVPLAFMRGRTFKNAIVLADEMQNASFAQIKNLVTRLGEHSRIVINGDLSQSDLQDRLQGGLETFINKLCDGSIDEIGYIRFEREDIVRNPLIAKILNKLEYNIIAPKPIKDAWREEYYEEYDNED